MSVCPEKTLGILGGMGPIAAAEFLRLLACGSPAKCDQEHPRVLFLSEPAIPDRNDSILGKGENPLPMLKRSLELLVEWGADLLAVPCNTAHHFIDSIREELGAPLVHIVEATVGAAKRCSPNGAWLLATSGTRASGLYPACAQRSDYKFFEPSEPQQERVQRSLRLVKAGELDQAAQCLKEVIRELWREHEAMIVTACTELPLAYAASGLPLEREVSSLQALADACIDILYDRERR